jgi:hypothetical protein
MLFIMLILLIASSAITPVKRKHDKVASEDEYEEFDYIPESDEMRKKLAKLEEYRRLGWAEKKTKASKKLKEAYGKLFKQLQGQGVDLEKGPSAPGGYQASMLDWRKPYAGCSRRLRQKMQRENGDEVSSDSDGESGHPSTTGPPKKRGKLLSRKYIDEADSESESYHLSSNSSNKSVEEAPDGEESDNDNILTDPEDPMMQ